VRGRKEGFKKDTSLGMACCGESEGLTFGAVGAEGGMIRIWEKGGILPWRDKADALSTCVAGRWGGQRGIPQQGLSNGEDVD